jgi:hypothetical protein
VDEVQLPVDIPGSEIGNLRDFRQRVAMHKKLEGLAILRLALMGPCGVPDSECRVAAFICVALFSGLAAP